MLKWKRNLFYHRIRKRKGRTKGGIKMRGKKWGQKFEGVLLPQE